MRGARSVRCTPPACRGQTFRLGHRSREDEGLGGGRPRPRIPREFDSESVSAERASRPRSFGCRRVCPGVWPFPLSAAWAFAVMATAALYGGPYDAPCAPEARRRIAGGGAKRHHRIRMPNGMRPGRGAGGQRPHRGPSSVPSSRMAGRAGAPRGRKGPGMARKLRRWNRIQSEARYSRTSWRNRGGPRGPQPARAQAVTGCDLIRDSILPGPFCTVLGNGLASDRGSVCYNCQGPKDHRRIRRLRHQFKEVSHQTNPAAMS